MQNPDSLGRTSPDSPVIRLLTSILRLFFKLLYHQFAWSYDWVAWVVSLGLWQKWVLSVVPYLEGPRTLEIGFGPGHLQVALSRKGITHFGLDESVQMGRTAQRRLIRLGFHPNLIRGDALAMPFAECSFHQVVMTFPSEYILDPASLAEIHRVLYDGGTAIMLPLAWITGRKPLERTVAWINRITGEAADWNEKSLDPLRKAGFMVSWELIEFDTSKVLLVRMVKSVRTC